MKTKSIWKALLGAILMCCLVFALAACAGKYTVTFNYGYDGDGDGNADTQTVEVTEGGLVTAPETPTRDGYTFAGWYLGNEEWNFAEDTVTEDITLEAKWSEGGAIDPGTPSAEAYLNYSAGELTEVSVPERQKVTVGQTVKLPAALEADGYVFMGWLVQGETEPRAAGSDYTVTGTVTITAQWDARIKIQPTWSTDGVFDMTGENEFAVNKDLVGTYQPTEGEPVTVTITKAELEAALEVFKGTIEQGHPQTTPAAGAFHATSEEATCTEAGEGTIQYTVSYLVPGTNYYVSESVVLYSQVFPANGHSISWSYDADTIADELMQHSVQVSGTCYYCQNPFTETLPQIVQDETNGNFWFADEIDWGAMDNYLPKKAEADIEAGEYYITSYYAPGCESEGNISGYYLSETYGEISFGGCSLSATGHSYPDYATYADGVWKVVCGNGCGTDYTLSITFNANEATGDAPSVNSVSFDIQNKMFKFNLPSECPYTHDSLFFDGWSDGVKAYGNGAEVTVAVTDGTSASVTITAQWTSEHTHIYSEPAYDPESGKVVRICSLCDNRAEYDVTSITVEANAPTQLVVTDTAAETVVALPSDLLVHARGDWESENSTDVVIPVSELSGKIKSYTYNNATITVSLGGVSVDIENVKLFTQALEEGFLSSSTQKIGDFSGEFEISFSLSDIVVGSDNWNAWVLTFESNNLKAKFRVDNWVESNFGRTEGQFTNGAATGAGLELTGFTDESSEFWNEMKAFTNATFTIVRTYNASGYYQLSVTVSDGAKTAVLTLDEPTTTGNAMSVTLEANVSGFNYSAINAANEAFSNPVSITAEDTSVPFGTELNNVKPNVYLHHEGRALKDLLASGYSLSSSTYNAQSSATYDVTVEYESFDAVTIRVTVEASVNKTKVKGFSVVDGAFTDGGSFTQTDGVTDNGFHAAAAVTTGNPFKGAQIVDGISIDLVVYGNTTVEWAPILSINKANGEGFLTVAARVGNTIGVSANDFAGNYVDHEVGTFRADTQTRVTVTITREGTITVYVDGNSVELTAAVTGSLTTLVGDITSSSSAFESLTFFGGVSFWTGNFSGSVVSCDLYNYVLSASEVSGT